MRFYKIINFAKIDIIKQLLQVLMSGSGTFLMSRTQDLGSWILRYYGLWIQLLPCVSKLQHQKQHCTTLHCIPKCELARHYIAQLVLILSAS